MVGDEIVEDAIVVPSPELSQCRQIACRCAMRAPWTDWQDAVALTDTALIHRVTLKLEAYHEQSSRFV